METDLLGNLIELPKPKKVKPESTPKWENPTTPITPYSVVKQGNTTWLLHPPLEASPSTKVEF
jgi:hypothetical protein